MSMEQPAMNVDKIKNIADEIVSDLERYLNMYKNHVVFLRGRIRRDKQEAEVLLQTVTSTLNEMKERNERLIDERNELKERIEQDIAELKNSENERHELMSQIRELEMHNVELKETSKEKKSMLWNLIKKAEMISEKNKQKEIQVESKVLCFKKYLGMSIIPIRENVIKVVFDRICQDEGVECFLTLDLSADASVIDLFPRIHDLERLNLLFRKHDNFHDFLKVVRNDFKKEYSRIQ